jgi:hypothetical protein
VEDKVYATKVTGLENLKSRTKDVTATDDTLDPTLQKQEIPMDVLRVTTGAHTKIYSHEYECDYIEGLDW